jgi:Tfp pilus assembly protein PilW
MGGMTLTETLITVGVGGMFLAMMAMVFANTSQSFAVMSNRVSMSHESRMALDQMTRASAGPGTGQLLHQPTRLYFRRHQQPDLPL